jgi:hypothetical protein
MDEAIDTLAQLAINVVTSDAEVAAKEQADEEESEEKTLKEVLDKMDLDTTINNDVLGKPKDAKREAKSDPRQLTLNSKRNIVALKT